MAHEKTRVFAVALCLICAAAAPADAARLPRYGAFVYSSVCWEEQSGDAAGNRITLVRTGNGDRLGWEWSEGPMAGPNPAYDVSINDQTGAIRFSVDIGSEVGEDQAGHRSVEKPYIEKFSGIITDDAIILGPDGLSGRTFTLPRLRDFSAKEKECK